MSTAAAKGHDQKGTRTLFVDLIHQALRTDGARLLASVAVLVTDQRESRLAAVRAFFDQYSDQLLLHHSHEDKLFYPALEARVGPDRMALGEMARQHESLHPALEAASECLAALADPASDFTTERTAACDAISHLNKSVATHLDLEEATVLPLLESEIPAIEYRRLETQARRATSRAQTEFLIPWLVAHATPEQRRAVFRSAPPLRLVNLVTGRRYRRLDHALARMT
jgi:hemerythrin-like domain-containing protein